MHTQEQYFDKVTAIKVIAENGKSQASDDVEKNTYENIIQLATELASDFKPGNEMNAVASDSMVKEAWNASEEVSVMEDNLQTIVSVMEDNLQTIIAGYADLIGRAYTNDENEGFTFIGILYAEEDIYYVMSHKDSTKQTWVSCTIDLSTAGYSLSD